MRGVQAAVHIVGGCCVLPAPVCGPGSVGPLLLSLIFSHDHWALSVMLFIFLSLN